MCIYIENYDLIQPYVKRACMKYSYLSIDFDDLVQECNIRIWKSSNNFNNKSKYSTFAYSVSNNTCIDFFRKEKLKNKVIAPYDVDFVKFIPYDDFYDNTLEDQYMVLTSKMGYLKDVDYDLIDLRLNDVAYSDISKIMNISENKARVRVNRAKNKLKDLIQQQ